FCREVGFWSQLRHPNVLPFWGCWELDEYRLFMISPWAAHGNSLEYVRNNPTVDRRPILQQTAEALAYLHSGEHGPAVVHGDLKADNVLISGSGDALLADFGLTRYVEKLAMVSGTPSGLSAHGHIRFSAPELLYPQPGEESRPTPESDVFAFGCFLIQLYTEELPFAEIRIEAHLITEIIKGRTPMRPTGAAVKRGLDDSLWEVASNCWDFDVSQRPKMKRVADRLQLTSSMD
ncbi:kinase-like domain-containing protein, partial [Hysterangium stoloniferum]